MCRSRTLSVFSMRVLNVQANFLPRLPSGFIASSVDIHCSKRNRSSCTPHLQIAGPKSTTVPQAGLDTKARAGDLAQLIVDELNKDPALDPKLFLNYNPKNWRDINDVPFNATTNWLRPVVPTIVNRRRDVFSPRYV